MNRHYVSFLDVMTGFVGVMCILLAVSAKHWGQQAQQEDPGFLILEWVLEGPGAGNLTAADCLDLAPYEPARSTHFATVTTGKATLVVSLAGQWRRPEAGSMTPEELRVRPWAWQNRTLTSLVLFDAATPEGKTVVAQPLPLRSPQDVEQLVDRLNATLSQRPDAAPPSNFRFVLDRSGTDQ